MPGGSFAGGLRFFASSALRCSVPATPATLSLAEVAWQLLQQPQEHPVAAAPVFPGMERPWFAHLQAYVAVECVPSGGSACQPDAMGNVGLGHVGADNFGRGCVGNNNIGGGLGHSRSWVPGKLEGAMLIRAMATPRIPAAGGQACTAAPHLTRSIHARVSLLPRLQQLWQ
jgi:hypothetical protein